MRLIQSYYEKHGLNFLINIYLKLFVRTSDRKIKWLRLCGANIGNGTAIRCSLSAFPEPFMINLGENVYIADGVQFFTHDGSLSWLTRKMGLTDKRTEKIGLITVGDNCFIGARAMIMQDVNIGKNCIVAAGALVSKDVPDGSVVGGVPAKTISTIDQYLERNNHRKDYTCGLSYYDKRKYYEKNSAEETDNEKSVDCIM